MGSAPTWRSRRSGCRRRSSSAPTLCVQAGESGTRPLERLWTRDPTITMGLDATFSIPTLLSLISVGGIDPLQFTTHRFAMRDTLDAYDTFTRAAETNAIKVTLSA